MLLLSTKLNNESAKVSSKPFILTGYYNNCFLVKLSHTFFKKK